MVYERSEGFGEIPREGENRHESKADDLTANLLEKYLERTLRIKYNEVRREESQNLKRFAMIEIVKKTEDEFS
ncbi:hypothetical protein GWI33_022275 [Rhynchophorus ferrugineus]|uniref:Uncharacterized protein n=1 Tax=Rhynchophorus ferrugineus TaxID=354439 RepID=A0A834IQU6_RHYFE|nr:hypothetical protein GWI33_022275 [Rhynchophorus ferrugineus]